MQHGWGGVDTSRHGVPTILDYLVYCTCVPVIHTLYNLLWIITARKALVKKGIFQIISNNFIYVILCMLGVAFFQTLGVSRAV
jgi:hypothetical protein